MNIIPSDSLSAKVSHIYPSSDSILYFLAIRPSNQSKTRFNNKNINTNFREYFINKTAIKAMTTDKPETIFGLTFGKGNFNR